MAEYCGNCGKKMIPGAAFCPYCGAAVPKEEKQPAASPGNNNEKKPTSSPRSRNSKKPDLLCIVLIIALLIETGIAGFVKPGFLIRDPDPGNVPPEETVQPVLPGTNRTDVDLDPMEGMHVHAPIGSLYETTKLSFTPVTEADERVTAFNDLLYEEDRFLLSLWEIDAGLEDGTVLPGDYTVTLDLAAMGIPESLYEGIQIVRLDDNDVVKILNSERNGGTLTYSSNSNCLDGIIWGTVAVGIITVPIVVYNRETDEKTGYYNGETMETWSANCGWLDYRVCWKMEDVDPDHAAVTKALYELEQRLKQEAEADYAEEEKIAEAAYGRLAWLFHKNTSVAERLASLQANNAEYQRLVKENKCPKVIQEMCREIETAAEYLGDRCAVKMPTFQVDFLIKKKTGKKGEDDNEGGTATGKNFYYPYIEIMFSEADSAKLRLTDPGSKLYWDNMLLTISHELFHICQENYRLTSWTDSNRFDEMTALVLESDAKEYYQIYDIITTDPKLTNSRYEVSLVCPIDADPTGYKENAKKSAFDLRKYQGYLLADFVMFLRKKTGKYLVSGPSLVRTTSSLEYPYISDSLKQGFDLSEEAFDTYFRQWCLINRSKFRDSYQEGFNQSWVADLNYPASTVPYNTAVQFPLKPKFDKYYSAPVRLLKSGSEPCAWLLIIDPETQKNHPEINVVPCGNYRKISRGAYIAPLKYRNGRAYPNQYFLEVYGYPSAGSSYDGSFYTVYTVTAPEKPVLSQNENELIIQLPEPRGAAKDGLVDGMRVNITINENTEKTVMVNKAELGTEVRIPLNELMSKDQSELNAAVTLEEYVLSTSGEKLFFPMSEAASVKTEASDGVFEDLLLVYDDLGAPFDYDALSAISSPAPEFPSSNVVIAETEDVYFDLSPVKLNIHVENSDGVVDEKVTRRGFTMKGVVKSRSDNSITGVLTEIPEDLYGSVYHKQIGYTDEISNAEGTINFRTKSVSTDGSSFTIEMENGKLKEIRIIFKVDLETDNIIESDDHNQYIYIEDGQKDYTIVLKPSK